MELRLCAWREVVMASDFWRGVVRALCEPRAKMELSFS